MANALGAAEEVPEGAEECDAAKQAAAYFATKLLGSLEWES